MEALEFLKEEIRFCREHECCADCEVSRYCSFLNRPRHLTNDCIESRIHIIEGWSKEHTIITNEMKFKEVFGQLKTSGPMFYAEAGWWNAPYKEP